MGRPKGVKNKPNPNKLRKLSNRNREILGEVVNTSQTLQAIADTYGVTRERIRQIAVKYLGVTGTERIAVRRVEKQFELKRGQYPPHVVAVWKEAMKRGYEVKGFIDRKILRKNVIFINRRMVVVYHSESVWRINDKGRYYTHLSFRFQEKCHIIVFDNPLDHVRTFYILPREFCKGLSTSVYIPLTPINPHYTPRAKHNFEPYKDAWHILEDSNWLEKVRGRWPGEEPIEELLDRLKEGQ